MSLEERIAEETKNIEVNKFSGLRPEIRALEEKKDKIKNSHDHLQNLSGLQPNEVKDFLKTKEVIEKVLRKNKAVLAEKGIIDKKGIIEAYPEDEDVENYKESHQKLKSTAKGILEERKVLKEEGIKNIRGQEVRSEVEEKIESFDEEINTIKKRSPEAKRFIENFRKDSVINGRRSINDINFISADRLKEAREHGFENEEIKQIIKEGFSSEEGIKSLRDDYEEITSATDKNYDQQQIREAKKKVRVVEAQLEAKINMDWTKAEKEIFYEENKVEEVENEKEALKEKDKKYSELIDGIKEKSLNPGDKIIFGEELLPENWEEKSKKINTFNELDEKKVSLLREINDLKNSEPKVFKIKWQSQLDKLENRKEELTEEMSQIYNEVSYSSGFKKFIKKLEPMIKNLGIDQELKGKEMTLDELTNFFYKKKFSLDSEEGLSQEKKEILRSWWNLKEAFDRASSYYKNGSYKNSVY